MAQCLGLLISECWLMQEDLRKSQTRRVEPVLNHLAAHNVFPKDIAREFLFAAEMTLTYKVSGEERLRYINPDIFDGLLFNCFNFRNFKPSKFTYECN